MENNHEGFDNVTQKLKSQQKLMSSMMKEFLAFMKWLGPLAYHGSLFDLAKTYSDYSMGMVSQYVA